MRFRTLALSSVAVAMTGAVGIAPVVSAGVRPVTNLPGTLTGVSANSPSDAWAVGCECNVLSSTERTLILHWNGTRWQRF